MEVQTLTEKGKCPQESKTLESEIQNQSSDTCDPFQTNVKSEEDFNWMMIIYLEAGKSQEQT